MKREGIRGKLIWSSEPPSDKFYFISADTYAVCYPRILVETTGENYVVNQLYNGEKWFLD